MSYITTAADADLLARLQQSAASLVGPAQARRVAPIVQAMAREAVAFLRERQLSAAPNGTDLVPALPPLQAQPGILWLRPNDAARAAGISRALLYDWLNAGRLVTRKIGGVRLILTASLAELEDAPGGRNGRPRRDTGATR
jgi:hypothetical protein